MRHFLPALLFLSAVSAIPVEPTDELTSISTLDATTEQDTVYDSPPFMPHDASDDSFDTEYPTSSLDDPEVQAAFAEMGIDSSTFNSTDVDTEPEALAEAPHLASRQTSKSGVYCQTNHAKIHKYLRRKANSYVHARGTSMRRLKKVYFQQQRGTPGAKEMKCSLVLAQQGKLESRVRVSICGNHGRYLNGEQIGSAMQTIASRCADREGRVAGLYMFSNNLALVKVDNFHMGLDTTMLDW